MAKIAPQTIIDLYDQSDIASLTIDTENSPLFMAAITSDKGPEDLRVVSSDFFKYYGTTPSFARHGQPLLQAARTINAGARLLVKRVVAPDSTLGNIIVSAKVEKNTDVDATSKIKVTMMVTTVEDAKSISTIDAQAASTAVTSGDAARVYPLFTIYDIGRGLSNKKFRVIPDYRTSKDLDFMQYTLQIIEGASEIENITFSLNPDLIYAGFNYGLEAVSLKSTQIRARVYDHFVDLFAEYCGEQLTINKSDIYNMDILFGCSKIGQSLETIEFTEDSKNINSVLGINLQSGTNGTFGTNPLAASEYAEEMAKVFNGEATDEIYDITKYQLDAIVDANYPAVVKRAIENLVTFREDAFYFRDLGIVKTYEQIKSMHDQALHNKFSASNHISYDVIDPYTMKQITVTGNYTLAPLLVGHFKSGRNRAVAGMIHNMVYNDAIDGTVNYIPKVVPDLDQKQQLVDINVNYASYYESKLVLETQSTAQEKHTQFSYINNVLAVQEIIKMLRVRCPKTRYTFLDGDDFDSYKNDVNEQLKQYKTNFKELIFEYVADETAVQNKMFVATIKVTCRNYIESERFKIYVIG